MNDVNPTHSNEAASKVWPVVIIGSGFGGQCAAINLIKRGIEDFLILERREFMGGTWCQNTYPGAAVDVQSPLYSLSFEPYPWSQMFAKQGELENYTHHVIDKYRLRERTQTRANVSEVRWLEDEGVWQIHIDDDRSGGQIRRARAIINASGPLSTPVVPEFPGRESFAGTAFHTNDWDHEYDHRGKRVAIIGSGASAAQVIPAIAGEVGQLHVFQRTPHWVLPRPDRVFSRFERWLMGIKPLYRLLRWTIYLALESRVVGFKYSRFMLRLLAQRKAEKHLEEQIPDRQLRDNLTPDFTIGCKRIILSNTLYPALARDNVTLHTQDDGIGQVNEAGILTTTGEQLDLDLIVWSTGYDATDGMISYPVIGRNGQALSAFWHDYPRAYLGTAIPGFPNLFVVTGPNTGIGHTSAIFMIEAQMAYIMQCIDLLQNDRVSHVEVKPEAEDRYTDFVHAEMEKTVWHDGGCNSWYRSRSGRVIAMFPGFTFTYRKMARAFKRKDHVIA